MMKFKKDKFLKRKEFLFKEDPLAAVQAGIAFLGCSSAGKALGLWQAVS